jgi:hypothetical protein
MKARWHILELLVAVLLTAVAFALLTAFVTGWTTPG